MERYIVGLGEALWDCLPEGRKIGGAPANFAYHMNRFGFDSIVISAVGEDDLDVAHGSGFVKHKIIRGVRAQRIVISVTDLLPYV